jgi:hypothetical protein
MVNIRRVKKFKNPKEIAPVKTQAFARVSIIGQIIGLIIKNKSFVQIRISNER